MRACCHKYLRCIKQIPRKLAAKNKTFAIFCPHGKIATWYSNNKKMGMARHGAKISQRHCFDTRHKLYRTITEIGQCVRAVINNYAASNRSHVNLRQKTAHLRYFVLMSKSYLFKLLHGKIMHKDNEATKKGAEWMEKRY